MLAVFALAGFALADRMNGSGSDGQETALETVTMTEHTLQPARDDVEEQFLELEAEAETTEDGLTATAAGDAFAGSIGSGNAGGQTARIVTETSVEEALNPEAAPGSGAAADDVPADLFDDMPYLTPRIDLSDVRIADPVGPLMIDLCAGPETLPDTPEGCPSGLGGTIMTLDLDTDATYQAAVFAPGASGGRCAAGGDSTMSLMVALGEPGTLHVQIWQGPPDSSPPPGAYSGNFDVPDDVAAELTAALDAGESSVGYFCIEVPAMAGEVVVENFIVSSYPTHDGLPGPTTRDTFAIREGRPPSGISASGVDTLYVRNFRAADEEVWVKAVEIDLGTSASSVCNTGGRELGARGPTPNGMMEADVVGRLTNTIPIEIDDSWPYDPTFDTLAVHALDLAPARDYAICTYIVDTDPLGQVVYSEAATVSTPATRGIQIDLEAIGGNDVSPSSEIRGFEVQTPCGAFDVDYPGPNRRVTLSGVSCSGDPSVSTIVNHGGFPVRVRTYDQAGSDPVVSDEWIEVERTDLICGTRCGEDVSKVATIPLHGFDLTESGRQQAVIGHLDLMVSFTAADVDTTSPWVLGSLEPYDNSNPELPEYPRVFLRLDSVGVSASGDLTTGTMALRVYSDRNVDYTVTLDPTYPVCGADPVTEASGSFLGSGSRVELSGLCLGVLYPVTVEGVDEAGNRSAVTRSFFTDTSQTFTLYADLQLEPLPEIPSGFQWYQAFRPLQAVHRPSWPVLGPAGGSFESRFAEVIGPEGAGTEVAGTGWKSRGYVICDGATHPPFARRFVIRNVPMRSLDWSVSTTVVRFEYSPSDTNCQPSRNNPDAPLNISLKGVVTVTGSGFTFEDLLRGVEITGSTPYGSPTLRVWAER